MSRLLVPLGRAAELAVDRLPAQTEMQIPMHVADALLDGGGYEAVSLGLKEGKHYRKQRASGCYHLRIEGGRAFLHWDQWDPRRHPLRHTAETPELRAVVALGLTALALKGLVSAVWGRRE